MIRAMSHSLKSPYLETLEGPFIQIKGLLQADLGLEDQAIARSRWTKRSICERYHTDNNQSEESYCYLNKPRELEHV